MPVVGAAANFPQVATNRVRRDLIDEIVQYGGGENDPDASRRAVGSLREAVKSFNTVLWKFNRYQQDVTLVAATETYALNQYYRAPLRARYLDASNKDVGVALQWEPYETLKDWYGETAYSTSAAPSHYTCRNAHEDGYLWVWPIPATTLTYPTIRLDYFRRIAFPNGDDDKLDVPDEVEQAIMDLAVARFIAKEEGAREAAGQFAVAAQSRMAVEAEYRDWPDMAEIGI